jgi:hypothetical protein
MNDEVAIKIQAWVDGELSAWHGRGIAKSIERDAEAKALATELRQIKAALTTNEMTVAVLELREFYWNKIRLQIEREEAASQKRVSPAPAWNPMAIFRRVALPLAGVAVACAVAVLSVDQFSAQGSDEVSATSDEMSALTFHDQSAGMTVVWLQDNDQAATDENADSSEDNLI